MLNRDQRALFFDRHGINNHLDFAGAADHHRHLVYFAAWVKTWVEFFRQEKTLSCAVKQKMTV